MVKISHFLQKILLQLHKISRLLQKESMLFHKDCRLKPLGSSKHRLTQALNF